MRALEQEERQSTNRAHAAQISARVDARAAMKTDRTLTFVALAVRMSIFVIARGASSLADSRASTLEVCKERRLHDGLQRRSRYFIA